MRLVPLFPFNLTNYALGLTRVRFAAYAMTSFICMAPGARRSPPSCHGWFADAQWSRIPVDRDRRTGEQPRTGRRHHCRRALAEEFAGPLGHVETALNIPLGELPDRLIEIRAFQDRTVILVCKTHKRSAVAAAMLGDAGFRDVSVLRGGMEQWPHESRPVDR